MLWRKRYTALVLSSMCHQLFTVLGTQAFFYKLKFLFPTHCYLILKSYFKDHLNNQLHLTAQCVQNISVLIDCWLTRKFYVICKTRTLKWTFSTSSALKTSQKSPAIQTPSKAYLDIWNKTMERCQNIELQPHQMTSI